MTVYYIITALVTLAGLYLCSKTVYDEEPDFDHYALSLLISGFTGVFWIVTVPVLTFLGLCLFWHRFWR